MDNHTASSPPPRRLIIVEDDRYFRADISEYLTLDGYDITGAGSAQEFYALLYTGHYALAIIDIGLPDQSGLVVAEYVRANTDMRIIMLTAHSSAAERVAGYKAGADIYMVKPVDCSELSASIATLFERMDLS
ncbi:MAG: response regulator transcription factor [Chlorobium sp.]|jgi:DNA-binding response OmpR family regulator|nr:response regulator transcription factor [Chlorobium sp.]